MDMSVMKQKCASLLKVGEGRPHTIKLRSAMKWRSDSEASKTAISISQLQRPECRSRGMTGSSPDKLGKTAV
jgi:hypothetical protein